MDFLKYKNFILTESANFKRIYYLPMDWWSFWKKENESKFDIELNAIDKTYKVSDIKTKEVIFLYDYDRRKIFTNKDPEFFDIKDTEITPKELTDTTNKEKKEIEPPKTTEDKPSKKKEDPLGDLGLGEEE